MGDKKGQRPMGGRAGLPLAEFQSGKCLNGVCLESISSRVGPRQTHLSTAGSLVNMCDCELLCGPFIRLIISGFEEFHVEMS